MISKFKKIGRTKIRNKLLVLLLLVSLPPVLFLGLWSAYSFKQTRVEGIKEIQAQMVIQLNDRFKKFIDDKIESYRINIADPNVNAIGPEQQDYILKGLLLNDATVEEASFIGRNGKEESHISKTQAKSALKDFSKEASFKKAMEGKDFVGDIAFEDSTPQITIASPVVNQAGNIIAVLITKTNLSGLSEMMSKSVFGQTGYTYITDNSGLIAGISERLEAKKIKEKTNDPLLSQAEENDVKFSADISESLNKQRSFASAKKIPSLGWIIFAEWPANDALNVINKIINVLWLFMAVLAVFIIGVGIFFTKTLLRPLKTLKEGAALISNGTFDHQLVINTGDELEELGDDFNKMAAELKQFNDAQKTKQKNLENAFGQYVGGMSVEEILKGEGAKLGGERKYITVLFSDIKNFTTISEALEPEVLIRYLNKYLTVMSDIITKHGGFIDKYIGDAIVAFWGAPQKMEDHAYRACLAAEEMLAKLVDIQKEWRAQGLPEFDIRIGINTGGALVGNVGSNQRLSYTIIGDTVNLASRLEGINKEYKTRVIISQATHMEIMGKAIVRELDTVEVKGKTEGIKIFELIAVKNSVDSNTKKMIVEYEKALNLYRIRKWQTAIDTFSRILVDSPDDGPSQTIMARAQVLDRQPPSDPEWNGIFKATEK